MRLRDDTTMDSGLLTFVETTFGQMQDTIRKGEEVAPIIIFYAHENGRITICPVIGVSDMFNSYEAKKHVRAIVKTVWRKMWAAHVELRLHAVVMGMDTFVKKMPIDGSEKYLKGYRPGSLAEDPDAKEALVVQVSLRDREFMYQQIYARKGKQVVFSPDFMRLESDIDTKNQALLTGMWPL